MPSAARAEEALRGGADWLFESGWRVRRWLPDLRQTDVPGQRIAGRAKLPCRATGIPPTIHCQSVVQRIADGKLSDAGSGDRRRNLTRFEGEYVGGFAKRGGTIH